MKTRNWPLILFTLLSQCAAGMMLAWFTFEAFGVLPLASSQVWIIPMLITLLLAAAGSIAGLHLRKPQRAALAASNWRHSWLSREMIFALLFGTGTAVLTMLHFIRLPLVLLRLSIRSGTLLSAGMLLWSMINLYKLRTVPAWKMYTTALTFINTTLILGPTSLLTVLFLLSEPARLDNNTFEVLFQPVFLFTAGILLAQTLVFYQSIQQLNNSGRAGQESHRIMMEENKKLVYTRFSLSGILVILLVVFSLDVPAQNSLPVAMPVLLILLWLGEGVGKHLFYCSYTRKGF